MPALSTTEIAEKYKFFDNKYFHNPTKEALKLFLDKLNELSLERSDTKASIISTTNSRSALVYNQAFKSMKRLLETFTVLKGLSFEGIICNLNIA